MLGAYLNKHHRGLLNSQVLHKTIWYNLLLVVLLQFWLNGVQISYLYLILLGALVHLIPASLTFINKASLLPLQPFFLAYSTYGGGNRGVLALSLLAPQMLPYFFVFDVGIFLSLLLCYPLAARKVTKNTNTEHTNSQADSFRFASLIPVMITSGLILLGIYCHSLTTDFSQISALFGLAKWSLLVLISLYLGINFTIELKTSIKEYGKGLLIRFITSFLPLITLCWWLLPSADFYIALTILSLTLFLPVSSLAPQLTKSPSLQTWVTNQVVVSSAFFVILLILISAGMSLMSFIL